MKEDCLIVPRAVRRKLPPLGATRGQADPLIRSAFYMPHAIYGWYPIEFDGQNTFYGCTTGAVNEMGFFTLSEMQTISRVAGWSVVCREDFEERPLSIIRGY